MKISVYIPSYNQKDYLIEAIDSVLAQTLPPFQVIIVDDASSDGSQEVIAGYQSRYPHLITPIYHPENLGVSQTRIDGLQQVKGDYVTYVDGDDRFLPQKLEAEAQVLSSTPSAQVAFSNNYYMDVNGRRTGVWIKNDRPPQGDVFCQTFARDYPRNNLFRMELMPYPLLRKVGFHDTNLRLLEDWELRIRLAKHYQTVYVDRPLSEIRRHDTGLSKLGAAEKRRVLEYIWEKHQPLLNDVPAKDREYVTKKINWWRARFLRWQAKELLGLQSDRPVNRRDALKLYRQSLAHFRYIDMDLIFGLILPRSLYRRIRNPIRRKRQA